jgi:16S rRNA (cytidine1402-2'-O)-methyltransferase
VRIQKSFQDGGDNRSAEQCGTLYLVATPIGNLEDMTMRGLRTLREADWVAAEDTRHTRKLLAYFDIQTKLKSYHEHNRQESGRQLLQFLLQGQTVALVSDAGMPAISDPGYDLVKLALEHDVRVVTVPGVNAALTALVASGLPTEHFAFIGFLPREKKMRRRLLEQWQQRVETLLLYEAPHRLAQTLADVLAYWGDRELVVARELTKKFEEYWRGTVSECIAFVAEHGAKGEFCLVVSGYAADVHGTTGVAEVVDISESESVPAQVARLMAGGLDEKTAVRQAAKERGLPKRTVYNEYVRSK